MDHVETTVGRKLILADIRTCQIDRERGIPVYTQSLLLELPKAMPDASFLLWHDPKLPPPIQADALQAALGPLRSARELRELGPGFRITDLLTTDLFPRVKGTLEEHLVPGWVKAHQPRRLGILYDLIPLIFQERYLTDPMDRNRYMDGMRCLRRWDQLFAISESARRDAIRHAGVNPSRIHNIYGGLDPAKAEAIRSMGTPWLAEPLPLPYAVYVGGDDWRKNMEGAILGFADYRRRGGRLQALVLVCGMSESRRRDYLRTAEDSGLPRGSLVITGKVTDAELVALVKGADRSIFPSFYEGLGLPVIESYACGTPVLASNRSSLPELVPTSCSFDPYTPSSIADTMLAFDQDPALRQASLSMGLEVLETLTWPRCAQRVAEILAEKPKHETPQGNAVAAVGVLPPARTGIAPVNARHLRLLSTPLHFFSAFPTARERVAYPSPIWELLAHPRNLLAFQRREDYAQRLFVFGNSDHHQDTLEALRDLRDAPGQTWLYLHDGDLLGLWRRAFQEDLRAVASLYAQAYPQWRGGASSLLAEDRPRGIRPLVDLGREVGIIVHSQWAKDQVMKDLGAPPALGVHALFLPVEPHAVASPRKETPVLKLGTFGKPEKTKQLERLVAALQHLRRQRPASLLVAGFDASAFLTREGLAGTEGLEVIDNPSDEALMEAMRSVDVAVQLRYPSRGESSGVVSHLLGMAVPLVVTNAGSFSELEEAVALVPTDVSPEGLANAILQAHESVSLRQAAAAYRTAHLPEAYVAALDHLLAAHRSRKPV